jgi:hypothetical protein
MIKKWNRLAGNQLLRGPRAAAAVGSTSAPSRYCLNRVVRRKSLSVPFVPLLPSTMLDSMPRSAICHLPFPNFSFSTFQLNSFLSFNFPFALFSFSVCKCFISRGFARFRAISRGLYRGAA